VGSARAHTVAMRRGNMLLPASRSRSLRSRARSAIVRDTIESRPSQHVGLTKAPVKPCAIVRAPDLAIRYGCSRAAGRADITERGDEEVILRGLFHETAPAQWTILAQNIAASMGYAGTVSELDVDNSTTLEAPIHYSYSYERKNYPDWPNRRITPPIPPIGLISFDDEDKPSEPVFFGAPGRELSRATVELPDGYSAELPSDVKLQTEFAGHTASYSLEKGVLSAERVLVIKASKLAVNQWDAYKEFAKAVVADEGQYIQLVRAGAVAGMATARDVPEAAAFVDRAVEALRSHDVNAARDALAQAERLNNQQSNLWMVYASLYGMQRQNDKAREALKKEI
jgi:hypothetical protein